jgi:surfactin synthase thioesterase subunit
MFGRNERGYVEYSFPVQDSELATARGLVPVELGLEGICVDQGSRRKESSSDQPIPPHVLSVSSRYAPSLKKSNEYKRRRAQNRASQQAYRKRQEEHRKDLEETLTELEGLHSDLNKAYEILKVKYSAVKQELKTLQTYDRKHESMSSNPWYDVSGRRSGMASRSFESSAI